MSRVGTRVAPSRKVGELLPAGAGLTNLFMGGQPEVLPMPILEQPLPGRLLGAQPFLSSQGAFVVDAVSTGSQFIFLIINGRLFGKGRNGSARLGIGSDADIRVDVFVESEPATTPSGPFTIVAAAVESSAAIADGVIYTWGTNAGGRTGRGTTAGTTLVPTIANTAIDDWVLVDMGQFNGAAIRANGELYTWGTNANGVTGLGTTAGTSTSPTRVGTDADWAKVSVGDNHMVARKIDGTLWAWGTNRNGTGAQESAPTQIGSDSDWGNFMVGQAHTTAIKGGVVVSWGVNQFGRTGLGIATNTLTAEPTAVTTTNFTGTPLQVGAYQQHSTLVTTDGIFSTGGDSGSAGRLVVGSAVSRTTFGATVGLAAGQVDFADVTLDAGFNNGVTSFIVPRKV